MKEKKKIKSTESLKLRNKLTCLVREALKPSFRTRRYHFYAYGVILGDLWLDEVKKAHGKEGPLSPA